MKRNSGKKSPRKESRSSRSDAKDLAGQQKLKSILFVIGSFKEFGGRAICYKISHDGESGTPTLKILFQSIQCAQDHFSYERIGSKMFSFLCKRGSQENISYLDLSAGDPKKAANWVKTDFELPITTGKGLLPGVYKNWLYLIGFMQDDPTSCDGTSVWGQVYNLGDGFEYPLDHPPSCPLPDPQVLGPWKEDGLAVYTGQDNTLRVHNPVTNEWKTLVNGIVKMELRSYSVDLCGNIFYTYHWNNLVLEAYDIVRNKPRPRVQFDREHFPVFFPFVHVLSDGVLCFTSNEYGEVLYSRFVIDYKSPNPKPRLTKHMTFQCKGGRLIYSKTE